MVIVQLCPSVVTLVTLRQSHFGLCVGLGCNIVTFRESKGIGFSLVLQHRNSLVSKEGPEVTYPPLCGFGTIDAELHYSS